MTDKTTVTDKSPARKPPANAKRGPAPKLWTSSAVSTYGNPFGFIAVVAETKEEAIAKARESIKADTSHGGYVPAERYAQNLLDNLDAQMAEAPSGVAIDWSPASKSRKS